MIPRFDDHAANERTFLAWVRTAIAVVGFGLAAARIGNPTVALWSELALLGSGALVVAFAFFRMLALRKRIARKREFDDELLPADAFLLLLVMALFAMLGMFAVTVS